MNHMMALEPEVEIVERQPLIRAATSADEGAIVDLLHAQWPNLSVGEWERIFRLPWSAADCDLGFVLVDGGHIVGFIGTVCSSREIDGQPHELCNLVGWCVKPDYLTSSLGLLNAVIRTGRVITAVTPASVTQQIMKMLGFTLLETERRVFLPFSDLGTAVGKGVRVLGGIPEIEPHLTPAHRQIMRDHSATLCRHHLLLAGTGYSYIVTRRANQGVKSVIRSLAEKYAPRSAAGSDELPGGKPDEADRPRLDYQIRRAASKLARIPASEILFCSDPALLMQHLERAKLSILRRDRTLALVGDSRLLNGAAARGLRIPSIKYFRGKELHAHQIDNLYTEYVLLPL